LKSRSAPPSRKNGDDGQPDLFRNLAVSKHDLFETQPRASAAFYFSQSKRLLDLNCREVAKHCARAPCHQSTSLQDPVIPHSEDQLMQHVVIIGRFAEFAQTLTVPAKPLDLNA
jgi:hypothetical protein